MFRKIFIIVFLSVAVKLNGQIIGGFRLADSLTYSLYVEKNWNELIKAGNNALLNGHDYYYMRMRIGIAYYEKRNFAKAAFQFHKALIFSTNDQIALEYLFYSYYRYGRTSQALALLSSFYPQNRERIIKESKIRKNRMTIESFYSGTGTGEIISDPGTYFSDTEEGSQIATKYFINNALYASHAIGSNASYVHSYTNLIKDNYLNFYDGSTTAHLLPQRVIQNQYYGSFNFFSSNGWVVSPSFHLYTMGYPVISTSTTGMNRTIRTYNIRSNGLNAGFAISKLMQYFEISAESGYFNSNSTKKIQGAFSIMTYPLGNSELYFGGKISAGKELNSTSSKINLVKGFTAGFSVGRRVWLEFAGLTGDLNNYVDNNGMYIYNSSDILKNKLTGRLIMPLNKAGITIFAGGGISSYSSELINEDGIISYGTNRLNYSSNNFTGGISWNF